MFEKFNVWGIVQSHTYTLRDYADAPPNTPPPEAPKRQPESSSVRRWNPYDLILFFGAPALVTVLLFVHNVELPYAALGTLVTALAVFGALLFNLLVLVSTIGTAPPSTTPSNLYLDVVRELHANISYAILMAMLCICDLVAAVVSERAATVSIASPIFYYLGTMFLLTLLMILKRTAIVIDKTIGK